MQRDRTSFSGFGNTPFFLFFPFSIQPGTAEWNGPSITGTVLQYVILKVVGGGVYVLMELGRPNENGKSTLNHKAAELERPPLSPINEITAGTFHHDGPPAPPRLERSPEAAQNPSDDVLRIKNIL